MKKIKIVSLVLIILGINACEQDFEDDNFRPRDRESGWVQFRTDTTKTFNGSGDTLIPFDVQVPINKDGLEVSYTSEVVAGNPPSEALGDFTSEVPRNVGNVFDTLSVGIEQPDEYAIKYTINDVSSENDISVGIENSDRPTEHIVRVCPIPLKWDGEADPGGSFTLTLIPTDDPKVFETQTAWGTIGQNTYPATFEFNKLQSLTITSTNEDLTGGSGEMNTCEGTMEYTLQQEIFLDDPDNPRESEFIEFDVTLTPAD